MADVAIGPGEVATLPPIGRLLGVDVGDVRVGLAMSDAGQVVASPFETIPGHDDADRVAHEVATAIAAHDVVGIAVGYPRSMDGREGAAARRCRRVAELLAAITALPVLLWDERYSTVEAERTLLQADLRRSRRREVVDRVAASLILQGVLAARQLQRPGRRNP